MNTNPIDALTVAELIEELRAYESDTPVVVCANYGDRKRTMQAIAVTELNDNVFLNDTAYSDSGYAVVEEGDEREDSPRVVVLNYDKL